MTMADDTPIPLPMQRIVRTWWPLAAGWLLMTVEIPIYTAVIARLAEPKINLAAWGVTFPLVLIFGAPVMMMLAASAALNKDWDSYLKLRRFMGWIAVLVTLLHGLLAFTPLYDWLVINIIAVPAEIVEPARLGMRLMIPFAAGLAYRRFNYGVLIRFGHSQAVTVGVLIRLGTDAVLLTGLYWFGSMSGIAVATGTMAIAVTAEAIYSGLRIRPVLRDQLKPAPPVAEPLTLPATLTFYLPLVMTAVLQVLIQPILNAGLSRMPDTLESLAVWPIIFSFMILWTSAAMAYLEVVVVLLDEPQALNRLHRFTLLLGVIPTVLLAVTVLTPLAELWFKDISALPASLLGLAQLGLWVLLPMPMFRVLQSWYQGILLNGKWTRGITEAVAMFILVNSFIVWAGVIWGGTTGLYVGLVAMLAGNLAQTGWLWHRARPFIESLRAQEMQMPIFYAQRSGVK
jgi:hypothetical protein